MMTESVLDRIIQDRIWWVFMALIYIALIYSMSLHHVTGPVRSIVLTYFINEPADQLLTENYPENRTAAETGISLKKSDGWKLSSNHRDTALYLIGTESGELIYTPYRYRPLGIWLAGGVSWLTGMPVSYAFVFETPSPFWPPRSSSSPSAFTGLAC